VAEKIRLQQAKHRLELERKHALEWLQNKALKIVVRNLIGREWEYYLRASTQLSEPKQALQSEINMPAAAQQLTWGELDLNDDSKTFAEYGLVGDEEVLMLKRKVSDDTLKKSQEFESWFTQQRVNAMGDVTVRQEAVDHECFVDSQVTHSPAQAHSDGMVMDEEQKIKALSAACLHLLAATVASKIKLCC